MKHSWLFMVRFLGFGALGLRRFRPSVHLYPPLVLLSCLIASTAAPAGGNYGHDALTELQELRELLVPGFGREPEILIGVGGISLSNPGTGTVVPAFQLGSGSTSSPSAGTATLIDGFVVPSGYFLARSGPVPGRSGFRLTNPLAFRWAGTASTPPLQLTWQAGTLFDNVFDGATGSFVPFQIVPGGSTGEAPSTEPRLALAAEPAEETPGQGEGDDVFRTALLLPPLGAPSGEQPGNGPTDQPGEGGEGPVGEGPTEVGPGEEGPDPASVPGPLPVAGVAIAWRCSRRLRQRLRQGR
ncbi:hypothetical protein KBY84_12260 [Cyanobium sp. N.Huapi 1H5]|uniref:hypothetical protein n=1 Tax=Cyanobium sp. N.Huapi 1H5 TaxID=2823719 RepID=UPI0020CD5246|nr:hypothetical protein [Cyanobium sp. N.Huapi 1H5]MCP9838265.1 hypothetical protein [Cyanobium sp. N.Huapi 1H5]